MDRKRFVLILAVIIVGAALSWVIKYRQPTSAVSADWTSLPLEIGEWSGSADEVHAEVVALLQPNSLFSANYYDAEGVQVNLFLGDWSDDHGGPHSPMNCLPASGWTVVGATIRPIDVGGRQIDARRLSMQHRGIAYLMDFWYITPYGETSNDYQLKLFEMLTSLTLQPRHLTFVRFFSRDSEAGRIALDRFETAIISEIYDRLPDPTQ
jgi:EpsI family protein